MDSRLVAAQDFSLRLLSWLTAQIRNFRKISCFLVSLFFDSSGRVVTFQPNLLSFLKFFFV